MDVAAGHGSSRGLTLPPGLPERGLDEILGGFSSGGRLLEALDSMFDDRDWRHGLASARLHRVLTDRLGGGPLARWPVMTAQWVEALPAASVVERQVGHRARGVDWRATARLGWPPAKLVIRPRRRESDQLLVTSLRWTVEALIAVVRSAQRVWQAVDAPVRPQIEAAIALLDLSPVADAVADAPDRADLRHIAAEGHPWNVMAQVAAELLRFEQASPQELAQLVAPDEHWRLFHLAVLGEIVCAARESGRSVRSTGPVAGGAHCYEIDDLRVWIEGGGIADPDRPYDRITKTARGSRASLAPDIVLHHAASNSVWLLECKWYADGVRAIREGGRAALAYALDVEPLGLSSVTSVAVLPDHQIVEEAYFGTGAGTVGAIGVSHLAALLRSIS